MSVEERVEFLTQSIESHDRQLGELAERCDRLAEQQEKSWGVVEMLGRRLDRLAEITQLNFDRLTQAMTGLTNHVADHQRRLENLER